MTSEHDVNNIFDKIKKDVEKKKRQGLKRASYTYISNKFNQCTWRALIMKCYEAGYYNISKISFEDETLEGYTIRVQFA